VGRVGTFAYNFSRFFIYTVEYGEVVARLKPRIIHAHDLYTLQSAVRIGEWIDAEVIYDAHELESDRKANTPPVRKRLIIEQEKKYAPKATACVTVSNAIADEMVKELGVERPTVIFNAPIVGQVPKGWESRTVRADLNLSADTPLFVFVGKIWEISRGNQKIDLIIRSVCKNPGFHLALIGPVSDRAKRQIEDLIEDEGIEGRVHLVAPIPSEAIIHYIADADVGVYFMWPDTRNIDLTIPNKLFEFSLAGLPLVVTDLTSTRWFCSIANNALFFSSLEPDEVAQICYEAYENRDQYRPDVDKLAEIRRDYRWETQGQRLVELYRRVLSAAGQRGA
jgi:glycosyltransferase involved in cell wall biosynthesis